MNKVEHHNQPHHDHDDLCHQTLNSKGSFRSTACVVLALVATCAPVVLADTQAYEDVDPARRVDPTNVPTSQPVTAFHRNARPHGGVVSLELEQADIRAAQQHHVQPVLLLAVIKAESSFNPIVISKAGAVGLMQLVPETAIRHGVRLRCEREHYWWGPSTFDTS